MTEQSASGWIDLTEQGCVRSTRLARGPIETRAEVVGEDAEGRGVGATIGDGGRYDDETVRREVGEGSIVTLRPAVPAHAEGDDGEGGGGARGGADGAIDERADPRNARFGLAE